MEFFLHNKDDQKSKALVNLATTFKIDDDNYIIYYNTQVEKSTIDIYIGKISYGDESLNITKIDADKQDKFLSVVKQILAGDTPETQDSDYQNIIDTATIVLDSVQKIQIPTSALDNLTKYHNVEVKEDTNAEEVTAPQPVNNESEIDAEGTSNSEVENSSSTNTTENVDNEFTFDMPETNTDKEQPKEEVQVTEEKKEDKIETNEENKENVIDSNDKLSSLDSILSEKEEKNKEKKEKKQIISGKILFLLILAIVGSILLYFYGNTLE